MTSSHTARHILKPSGIDNDDRKDNVYETNGIDIQITLQDSTETNHSKEPLLYSIKRH
jgi:hypothetical protein